MLDHYFKDVFISFAFFFYRTPLTLYANYAMPKTTTYGDMVPEDKFAKMLRKIKGIPENDQAAQQEGDNAADN